jgi:hypothetical protein
VEHAGGNHGVFSVQAFRRLADRKRHGDDTLDMSDQRPTLFLLGVLRDFLESIPFHLGRGLTPDLGDGIAQPGILYFSELGEERFYISRLQFLCHVAYSRGCTRTM